MISLLAQTEGGGNPIGLLILVLPIALLYFMYRSQKRRAMQQQSLQRAAQVGDEILTTSGIFGTIVDEDEDEGTVVVEIAPGTNITMVRAGIARRVAEDEDEQEDEGEQEDEDEGDHVGHEGMDDDDGRAHGGDRPEGPIGHDHQPEGPIGS
jgi:preprotein translocase subunit YajC